MIMNEMIVIDLPSLQSIKLGQYALEGRFNDKPCSLTVQSMNEIE